MVVIPNWHPIFVHFTVGLFTTSVGFYTLSYFFTYLRVFSIIATELEITAQWCLWLVGIFVIATVIAGLQAYNIVGHHHEEQIMNLPTKSKSPILNREEHSHEHSHDDQ